MTDKELAELIAEMGKKEIDKSNASPIEKTAKKLLIEVLKQDVQ